LTDAAGTANADAMRDAEHQLFDVLARLIDPPLAPEDGEVDLPIEQQIESRFRQLPWAVEYAVIDWLHADDPGLFAKPPTDRFEHAFYPDAHDDLKNAGSYYAGRSFILDYQVSASYTGAWKAVSSRTGGLGLGADRIEAWMREQGLFEPNDDGLDAHLAVRAFIVNILVPAYGLGVLGRLRLGREFPDYPYVVDFLLDTGQGGVVIEVDGREYHDSARVGRDRFETDLKHQNRLRALGHTVFRYPARRILQEPETVIDELKQNVPWFKPVQAALVTEAGPHGRHDAENARIALAEEYCEWFRPVQLALLLALSRSPGQEVFRILDRASPRGLLDLVLRDLSYLADRVQKLFGVSASWPKRVAVVSGEPIHADLIDRYTHATLRGPDRLEGTGAFEVTREIASASCEATAAELVVDLRREGRIPIVPEGRKPDVLGRESKCAGVMQGRLDALSLPRPGDRNILRPVDLRKQLLDYFVRRLLRIPSLYHHWDEERPKRQERQYELLRRVLAGEDVFAIMPTGRGKSVAFQLPAMLLPGSALVISPLRALMRDQVDDLRLSRGWNSVRSVRYDLRGNVKDRAIDDFLRGRVRLLYISPERLQEKRFSTRLDQAAATAHVSFIAIDEAHCVSEWGHDFRLSYMEIPHFLKRIRKRQQGHSCPTVALTATASPPVQRDVCSILGLNPRDVRHKGHLIAEANIDRTELSLSVHCVDGSDYPRDRQKTLRTTLLRAVPTALRANHAFHWVGFANGSWRGRGAGVIFCLYKNPRGQTSWHDGVGAVRDHLLERAIVSADAVRLYAADSPHFCPACERDGRKNYTIRRVPKQRAHSAGEKVMQAISGRAGGDGTYLCSAGHTFSQPLFHTDWAGQLAETQYRFKKNEFPLLVTTKAYGMGIDHRGLRFVVHYGLPSSLESYYQEIGRAGRDDLQAHCALLVRLPDAECLEQFIERPITYAAYDEAADEEILPPCLFGKCRIQRQCPKEIGLPEPCDLSRQLIMLLDAYHKPETFAEGCADFWEQLVAKADGAGRVVYYVRGGGIKADKKFQKTHNYLFRLQQLELVRRFTLEYVPKQSKSSPVFDLRYHIQMNERVSLGHLERSRAARIAEIHALYREPPEGKTTEIADVYRPQVAQKCAPSAQGAPTRADIEEAVRQLFAATRAHVIKMRMESFAKLLRYVRSADACRRKELLGGMTAGVHGDDSFCCEFCDSRSCVPNLRFRRARAASPPDGLQFKDLFSKVAETFITQDLDDVQQVIQEAIERGIVDALQHQATTHIESDPDNLAANLMAAEAFAAKKRPDMHRYFRNFARVTNAERRDLTLAQLGYDQYFRHAPADAVRAFAMADTAFDSREGLLRLAEDAKSAELDRAERENLDWAILVKLNKEFSNAIVHPSLEEARAFFE